VENHGPVHIDIIFILEIQEFFSGELSASVDDARVRDPEMKNDVLDKINGLLGANFNQGFTPMHLVNLSTTMSRWVNVIPRSEKEGTKPPYVCSGCSNHTYGNNMITRFHVQ
jgi:hypothetical protein